jgi:hypothetical protein
MKRIINWIKSFFVKPPKKEEVVVAPKKQYVPMKLKDFRVRKGMMLECPVTFKKCYKEARCKSVAEQKSTKLIKLRGYKCEFCNHWHLTHKPNKFKMH